MADRADVKVLVWTSGKPGDGSFHYRINAPMVEAQYQGLLEWKYQQVLSSTDLVDVDVVVAHRLTQPVALGAWEQIAEAGEQLLVVEHDDDMVNVRKDNPLFTKHGELVWEYFRDDCIPAIKRSLEIADLITVTVPHLAEQYRQYTDAPILVLPNTVDEVLFEVPQRVRQPGEQFVAGWAGTFTHDIDWRSAGKGVAYGLGKADAHLVMMGSNYARKIGYRDASFVEWANRMDEYYYELTKWHVALAPLADELFNRSKSPLKALEAGALGLPIVASAAGPYPDYVINGETGFLCRTDDEWMKALRALANDEEMRQEMGRRGREHAKGFITRDWAPRLADAYRTALDAKRGARVA